MLKEMSLRFYLVREQLVLELVLVTVRCLSNEIRENGPEVRGNISLFL